MQSIHLQVIHELRDKLERLQGLMRASVPDAILPRSSTRRLLRHAHNRYLAEIDYGSTAVGRHRRLSAGSPGTQMKPNAG